MDNKQNEELQSRREFFKKAAKAALPVIGAVVLADLPIVTHAAPSGCEKQCTAQCGMLCTGCWTGCTGCTGTCSHSCEGGCKGGCKTGCGRMVSSAPSGWDEMYR
ncbi:MAG: Cys-Xaa-Xaa-Xaa repeat radical SAM target protein [Bacteroidales bacterium]|nr:Cys-Xaa-Xaa-Xaa repeat radical SAM target protein [Candidatus Colicola equi]